MIKRKKLNDKISIFILPLKESEEETEIIGRYLRRVSKRVITLNKDTKNSLLEEYDFIKDIHFIETKEKVLIMLNPKYIKPVSLELSQSILNIIETLKQSEKIRNNISGIPQHFLWRKPVMTTPYDVIVSRRKLIQQNGNWKLKDKLLTLWKNHWF